MPTRTEWWGWVKVKENDYGSLVYSYSKVHELEVGSMQTECGLTVPADYYDGHTSGPRCLKCSHA